MSAKKLKERLQNRISNRNRLTESTFIPKTHTPVKRRMNNTLQQFHSKTNKSNHQQLKKKLYYHTLNKYDKYENTTEQR